MVQQLTREGFWRRRSRKALPMGLKHSTTCRRCLHCCVKKPHSSTGLSKPSLLAAGRTISRICMTLLTCLHKTDMLLYCAVKISGPDNLLYSGCVNVKIRL